MKKIILCILAAALLLSAAACAKPTDKAAETGMASDGTYNVGDFTVFVPEGWTAIPVPDHTDPAKTASDDILLAKGAVYSEAQNTWNTDSCPSFYITYLGKEDFSGAPGGREYYAANFTVTDMPDTKIGSLTWQGYSVNPIGAPVYMMWAASGEGGYYTSLSTAYGLTLEDADVQAILGSLK